VPPHHLSDLGDAQAREHSGVPQYPPQHTRSASLRAKDAAGSESAGPPPDAAASARASHHGSSKSLSTPRGGREEDAARAAEERAADARWREGLGEHHPDARVGFHPAVTSPQNAYRGTVYGQPAPVTGDATPACGNAPASPPTTLPQPAATPASPARKKKSLQSSIKSMLSSLRGSRASRTPHAPGFDSPGSPKVLVAPAPAPCRRRACA
jgi:hypothetical protein